VGADDLKVRVCVCVCVCQDCGCGVGGPAREIARFSGCRVLGINNNEYQVQRAKKHTADQGLTERVQFI
jgi:sterol 24-C-methyltransferase